MQPIDGSPPGSPVPGILQARTLEWVAISFSNAWKWKVKGKSLSRVQLLATPWTAAHQAPPSMGFSRQEYWSGVLLPSLAGSVKSRLKQKLSGENQNKITQHTSKQKWILLCFVFKNVIYWRNYGQGYYQWVKLLSCVWLFMTPWKGPWNSPGQNTGVGRHSLLQEIFPTQAPSPGLQHRGWILYQLSHQGSPRILEWVAYPFSRGSSQPRNWTGVSCIAGRFFTSWETREVQEEGKETSAYEGWIGRWNY